MNDKSKAKIEQEPEVGLSDNSVLLECAQYHQDVADAKLETMRELIEMDALGDREARKGWHDSIDQHLCWALLLEAL